jgi:triosephosphate isomerase
LAERDSDKWKSVLKRQTVEGLKGVTEEQFEEVIIAYEPVWAIGTGRTASPSQAQEAHEFIRGVLAETFGENVAKKTRLQYGGSVKPNNARELLHQPDIDGALVGGACLDPAGFAEIIKSACTD